MIKEECGNCGTELSPQHALEKEGRKCSPQIHYLFIFPQNEVRALACWQSSAAYFISPSCLLPLTSEVLAENCRFGSATKKNFKNTIRITTT